MLGICLCYREFQRSLLIHGFYLGGLGNLIEMMEWILGLKLVAQDL
jgi:hypothetical protein